MADHENLLLRAARQRVVQRREHARLQFVAALPAFRSPARVFESDGRNAVVRQALEVAEVALVNAVDHFDIEPQLLANDPAGVLGARVFAREQALRAEPLGRFAVFKQRREMGTLDGAGRRLGGGAADVPAQGSVARAGGRRRGLRAGTAWRPSSSFPGGRAGPAPC